jgi:hypothetical protein
MNQTMNQVNVAGTAGQPIATTLTVILSVAKDPGATEKRLPCSPWILRYAQDDGVNPGSPCRTGV